MISGWWLTKPLCKVNMKVSWDYYSQYTEKLKLCSSHHQPDLKWTFPKVIGGGTQLPACLFKWCIEHSSLDFHSCMFLGLPSTATSETAESAAPPVLTFSSACDYFPNNDSLGLSLGLWMYLQTMLLFSLFFLMTRGFIPWMISFSIVFHSHVSLCNFP